MIIDFVEPRWPPRRAWVAVLALATLAVALFVAGLVLRTRAHAMDAIQRLPVLVLARSPSLASRPPVGDPAGWLRALDRAALPEVPALAELESVAVPGIQLASIEVSMADHAVSVELSASSDVVLDDYLDQLNAGQAKPAWRLLRIATSTTAPEGLPGAVPAAPGGIERATIVSRF